MLHVKNCHLNCDFFFILSTGQMSSDQADQAGHAYISSAQSAPPPLPPVQHTQHCLMAFWGEPRFQEFGFFQNSFLVEFLDPI